MEKLDIRQLRKKLELQRQEIKQSLHHLDQETRSLGVDCAQDPADLCVTSVSKETLFEQSSKRRTNLRLIEAALRRMEEGSFGECAGCGNEIPARRLQAVPWTQFCIRCQEAIEHENAADHGIPAFAGAMTPGLRRAG